MMVMRPSPLYVAGPMHGCAGPDSDPLKVLLAFGSIFRPRRPGLPLVEGRYILKDDAGRAHHAAGAGDAKSEGRAAPQYTTPRSPLLRSELFATYDAFFSFLVYCASLLQRTKRRLFRTTLFRLVLKLVFLGTHTIIFGKSREANDVLPLSPRRPGNLKSAIQRLGSPRYFKDAVSAGGAVVAMFGVEIFDRSFDQFFRVTSSRQFTRNGVEFSARWWIFSPGKRAHAAVTAEYVDECVRVDNAAGPIAGEQSKRLGRHIAPQFLVLGAHLALHLKVPAWRSRSASERMVPQ